MAEEEEANLAFGKRVERRRLDVGKTLRELGDEIGVTDQAVWKWQRGVRPRDRRTLRKLARALNTTEVYLEHGITQPADPESIDHELSRHIELLTELDRPMRHMIYRLTEEAVRVRKADAEDGVGPTWREEGVGEYYTEVPPGERDEAGEPDAPDVASGDSSPDLP